jgi:signal transduction histidine kinase/CheY-like chemotaxis protein
MKQTPDGQIHGESRTLRENAVLFPLTIPNVLVWLALTALGYLGNAANLPLFFNVDFLFGTIPVLLVLHFFGWAPAAVSALVAASHTAILWQHPYALIILTAELVFVGLLYRTRSRNLILLVTLYWLFLGMPLVVLFYRGVMGVAPTSSFLIVFKQAINGIFNALAASIIITLAEQIIPRLRHRPARANLQFAQVIFLVMVAFVLIPAMVILVVTARQEMTRVEDDVRTKLSITAFSTRQAVNAWVSENLQTLRSLSTYADLLEADQMEELRTEMQLLNMSDADFLTIVMTDPAGRILVAEPADTANRILANINPADWPYFEAIVGGMEATASNVIAPRTAHGTPCVVLGVPLISGDQVTGTVLGIVDTTRLADLLARSTGNWEVDATIVDGNGVIIESSHPEALAFDDYERHFPGPYEPVSRSLFLRVPEVMANVSIMERWQYSEYSTRDRIGPSSSWVLSLRAAVAPYQDALNQRYRSLMLTMILVIVITILLSAFVSRRMLASVVHLARVAEDLPGKVTGQEDITWPASRIDEIYTLIQCLKATGEQLGESFTRIQTANVELTRAKQEADLANRTKSEFLANISHDLRTPLNGILGYAQILMRDTSLDEETRNAVSIIEKSGNHLLNLINDILDVSRIEANKLNLASEPFRLPGFLDDIADIVSLQARHRGLQLHAEFDAELPRIVVGDEKRVRQVLLNLLNNAVKFTEHGHIWFRAAYRNSFLTVEVEDTGMGIPADQQEAVFSPFKQLTKHIQSEEGTGLGLAIVQRLVRMMNGEVSLESTVGKGSTFVVSIQLPSTEEEPPEVRSASTVTGYEGKRVAVLVVDDKEANRSVIRGMLAPLGFTVHEAVDGRQGIDEMRRLMPDIVLMDLVMPRLDGFEAIGEIRRTEELRDIRVVAVSASVASTIRDECLRLGFDDFLAKPFRDSELLRIMRRLLELEWTHRPGGATGTPSKASEDDAELVPPIEELRDLMEQVASGNIRGITAAADRLRDADERYAVFARRVRSLARDFQIDQLAGLVATIRSDQEDRGNEEADSDG